MGQLAAKMIMPSARVRNRCRIAALAVATLSLCLSNTYASTGAVDLTRGLLGRWTFDEGKGAIAGDVSGRDNHGKIEVLTNGSHVVAWTMIHNEHACEEGNQA